MGDLPPNDDVSFFKQEQTLSIMQYEWDKQYVLRALALSILFNFASCFSYIGTPFSISHLSKCTFHLLGTLS